MKTKIYILIIFLLVNTVTTAQKHYRYDFDLKTNKETFYKIKDSNNIKILKNAVFPKNSIVELHIKNYNPFVIIVKDSISGKNINNSQGYSIVDLLNQNANLKKTDFSSAKKLMERTTGTNSKASISEQSEDLIQFKESIEYFKSSESIILDFEYYLSNPNISKNEILENIVALINQKFITLLETPVDTDSKDVFEGLIKIESELLSRQKGNNSIIENSRRKLVENGTYSNDDINNIKSDINSYFSDTALNITQLRKLYNLVSTTPFEKIIEFRLDNDETNIDLQFIYKNKANEDTSKTFKKKNIYIAARGGYKVNTSVALSFTNFGDNANTYYIDGDGIIREDKNDYFAPSLVTMINFYPYLGKSVNIGGSFGVAIPITENSKGVSYLLGPSMFFGTKDRVSFSAGIAFAPAKRLKSYLNVEDNATQLNLGSNEITQDIYSIGYYFSVSFSLFSLNE